MKRKFLACIAIAAIVGSLFSFILKPNATVEVYIINNCGREVRVRVQQESSATSQTFYKDEQRKMYVKVGSTIDADNTGIYTVSSGSNGAKVYLCN